MNEPETRENALASGGGRARFFYGALALSLLAAAVAGAFFVYHRRARLTPERSFAVGQKNLAERQYALALKNFERAIRAAPDEPRYDWAASQAARLLGRRDRAEDHALAAWRKGLKNRETLLALVNLSGREGDTRMEYALRLLSELPDTPEREEFRGRVYFTFSKFEESAKIWTALYAKAPVPALADRIAVAEIRSGEVERARTLLKECRAGKTLDARGYGILIQLLALEDAYAEAEALFQDAQATGRMDRELALRHGMLLLALGKAPEAIRVFEGLKAPPAGTLPEGVEPPEDLNQEPESWEGILSRTGPDAVSHIARVYLAHLYTARAKSPGGDRNAWARELDELERLAKGESRLLAGERKFYRALRSPLRELEARAAALEEARTLTQGHPIMVLHLARARAEQGRYGEAARLYQELQATDAVLARSPLAIGEMADALARGGRLQDALQELARLHGRNVCSKATLALQRDLLFRAKMPGQSLEVQAFLAKSFPDDSELEWRGGLLALAAGAFGEAERIFDGLLAAHPESKDAEVARISVFLARGEYERALRECAQSRAAPGPLAALRARASLGLGRLSEAAVAYQTAFEALPTPRLALEYADLLARTGKPGEAEILYKKVLADAPRDPAAHLGLALLALQDGRWEAARAHGRAVLDAGDSTPWAERILALIDFHEGRLSSALGRSNALLGRDPNDLDGLALLGMIHLREGRFDEAEAALLRVYRARPSDPEIPRLLLASEAQAGHYDAALSRLEGLLQAKPDDLSLRRARIEILARAGRLAEAQAGLGEIQDRIAPAEYLLASARALELGGRVEEALALLGQHPEIPEAVVRRSWLRLRRGEAEGILAPLMGLAIPPEAWAALGREAGANNLHAVARDCYKKALEDRPDDPLLLNNLAWAMLQAGAFDPAELLETARRAHDLLPSRPEIIDTYANVLLVSGRYAEAVSLLTGARRIVDQSPRLLYFLALAQDKAGDRAAALETYKACLSAEGASARAGLPVGAKIVEERIRALQRETP
ncbi:MAG: tetratricopeptide repeat protein [Planctomycetota bacterium]